MDEKITKTAQADHPTANLSLDDFTRRVRHWAETYYANTAETNRREWKETNRLAKAQIKPQEPDVPQYRLYWDTCKTLTQLNYRFELEQRFQGLGVYGDAEWLQLQLDTAEALTESLEQQVAAGKIPALEIMAGLAGRWLEIQRNPAFCKAGAQVKRLAERISSLQTARNKLFRDSIKLQNP